MRIKSLIRLVFKFLFFGLFYRIDKFTLEVSKKFNFKNKDVLDIGAERSPYRSNFFGCNYYTLDVNQNKEKSINFIGDLNDGIPNIPDGRFDFIICTQVLEHLKKPSFAFKEFNRILKPGGKIFLTTNFFFEEHMSPNDFYRFTKHGLIYLGESNGFNVEHLRPHGGIFQILSYLIIRIPINIIFGRDNFFYYAYLIIFSVPIMILNVSSYFLDFLDFEKKMSLNYEVIYEKK